MTETDNLVLEHLRHIRPTTDALREDMREVKSRLGMLEHQYASLLSPMDRLRVSRIEERLGLIDAGRCRSRSNPP
jgi:hypothetical protein